MMNTKVKQPDFCVIEVSHKCMFRCKMCNYWQAKPNPNEVTIEELYKFRANGSTIKFDGFSRVWPIRIEEKTLPNLRIKEIVDLIELMKEQHFTEPAARYNEASLIKALEEHGIGRPSTYAPIISTIQERGYVIINNKVFFPQESGFIVTDLLVKNFPEIINLKFKDQIVCTKYY